MQISFWNGFDNTKRIHNIAFVVLENGSCYIEINSKDSTDKIGYLDELIEIMERETGKKYSKLESWNWQCDYPSNLYYLDALHNFIDTEKPIIDDYIKSHPKCGITMLDKEFNEKYVLSRLKQEDLIQKTIRKKHEGSVHISPSEYIALYKHNELQNRLIEHLNSDSEVSSIKSEDERVDISVIRSSERIFYELKTCDVKLAIRLAVGQLLEYCHYSAKKRADKLVVVTEYEPNESDIRYLNRLRSMYNLPIYYQQFDMNKNKLLDLH